MKIDELCELVLGLRARNFMGLNGAAAGVLGSADSGSDSIVQLQKATLNFAKAYQQADWEHAKTAKQEVIGKVMVAVALDALSEQRADQITDALVEIMKGKK